MSGPRPAGRRLLPCGNRKALRDSPRLLPDSPQPQPDSPQLWLRGREQAVGLIGLRVEQPSVIVAATRHQRWVFAVCCRMPTREERSMITTTGVGTYSYLMKVRLFTLSSDFTMKASTLLSLIAALLLTPKAMGALVLTIDNYTTSEVTLSISGSFDADVTGSIRGLLAVKSDWLNNKGTNTEWFTTSPTVTNSTVAFGGIVPAAQLDSANTWGDSVYWDKGSDIEAGDVVSGSVTLTGSFLPADQVSLDLVSGFAGSSWVRLETAAVPEPATIGTALFGMAGLALCYRRGRRRKCRLRAGNAA